MTEYKNSDCSNLVKAQWEVSLFGNLLTGFGFIHIQEVLCVFYDIDLGIAYI